MGLYCPLIMKNTIKSEVDRYYAKEKRYIARYTHRVHTCRSNIFYILQGRNAFMYGHL